MVAGRTPQGVALSLVTNRSKDKGDRAEREVQALLRSLLGMDSIRRALGAGRKDDVGDITGVPHTAVQVADWASPLRAIDTKLPEVEAQRLNAKKRFGVLFIRRRGGKYIVVMSPEMFVKMLRFAAKGIASTLTPEHVRIKARGDIRGGQ